MRHFNCGACKYEYESDWIDGKYQPVKGDNPPMLIFLSNSITAKIYNTKPFGDHIDTNFYACPKCKTIQIEI